MTNAFYFVLLVPAVVLSTLAYYIVVRRRPSILAKPWATITILGLPPFLLFILSFLTPTEFPTLTGEEWLSVVSIVIAAAPLSYTLYKLLTSSMRITSVALEVTSPDEMFNQRMLHPDSFDPFYDERFSIKQTERLIAWTPFEVSNRSPSSVIMRGVLLEVYPVINSTQPPKYAAKPTIITEFKVQPDLPFTIPRGDSKTLEISTTDLMGIGFAYEVHTPRGREGPYMRFRFVTQHGTEHSIRFHFGNYGHFVSLMISTNLRKRLAQLVDESIRNQASPSVLCDRAVELYGDTLTPSITALFYLRDYVQAKYPLAQPYLNEVQERIDKMTEPLIDSLEKALGKKIERV